MADHRLGRRFCASFGPSLLLVTPLLAGSALAQPNWQPLAPAGDPSQARPNRSPEFLPVPGSATSSGQGQGPIWRPVEGTASAPGGPPQWMAVEPGPPGPEAPFTALSPVHGGAESSGASPRTSQKAATPSTPKRSAPTSFAEAQELLKTLMLPSPLLTQGFQYSTAFQLPADVVKIGTNFRTYFPSTSIIPNSSTSVYAGWTFNFGITDTTELGIAFNRVDSSMPGKQGPFLADVTDGKNPAANDNVYTVQLQQQLWSNRSKTQALGAIVSAVFGTRSSTFRSSGDSNLKGESYTNNQVVPSLQLPFSVLAGSAWQFTLSPTAVFFPQDSALFLHTAPIENPGSFGTLAGLSSNISYRVNQRITLWSDTFLPLAGNNSINRSTGKPSKEFIFNAGLRYFVNPSLGLDLYASNSQGTMGPIGFLANPNQVAIGTNLVFLFSPTSSTSYAETFRQSANITPLFKTGFGLYEGGVAPPRTIIADAAYGNQGFNGLIGYSYVNDLDLSLYLAYTSGVIDESEQGLAGRIRLLDQYQGDPFTANLVATIGKTNQPFLNYLNNNANQFRESGLSKTIPFYADLDSLQTGQLWVTTASIPLIYQFSPKAVNSSALWITPIAGFVQRLTGLPLLGVNIGGAWAATKELSLIAELGANFGNRDNSFSGNFLTSELPWSVGLRWNPMGLLGEKIEAGNSYPLIYAYLTNRVGQTPWLSTRVRANNEPALGIGITIPWGIQQ